jgi:hypothetical protein
MRRRLTYCSKSILLTVNAYHVAVFSRRVRRGDRNLLTTLPNPQQRDEPYSPRRAWIGSTDAARRAGNADAARAKAKTVIAVRTTTTGSKGLT